MPHKNVSGQIALEMLHRTLANSCALLAEDERSIVWLDIDNTLYSASAGISHAMGERIHGPVTPSGSMLSTGC